MPAFNILIALTLMSAVIAVTFLLAWRTLGRSRHTLSWALAFLAATVHWFTALNMERFPSFGAYWLVASPSMLCFATFWLRGHCHRSTCEYLPKNLWPFAGGLYALIVWAVLIEPHIALATSVVPATVAVAMFLSAIIILRQQSVFRPAELTTFITMILFGLAQVGVLAASVMQGVDGDAAYRSLAINILFLALPPGYTALAVFALFMVVSDISDEMKALAISDQLTGLLNRRGFGERSAAVYATARRTDTPVAVIMTDIDMFKNINDEFGHASGDDALCQFADMLQEDRRADDILARMGGEEFALVLPGTSLDDAISLADDLCMRVQETGFTVDEVFIPMTASFGVSVLSERDSCLTDAINRADNALYRSKREGRNRVDLESSQRMRRSQAMLLPVSAKN